MKLYKYPLLTCIIFCSCNASIKQEKTVAVIDSTNYETKQANSVHTQDIANKILETWVDGSSENASFVIKKDSIIYADQFTSYKYELNGDSIKIKYPEMTYAGKVSFLKDSLVLESEGEMVKYWRFK
jgi:hypothetical protein